MSLHLRNKKKSLSAQAVMWWVCTFARRLTWTLRKKLANKTILQFVCSKLPKSLLCELARMCVIALVCNILLYMLYGFKLQVISVLRWLLIKSIDFRVLDMQKENIFLSNDLFTLEVGCTDMILVFGDMLCLAVDIICVARHTTDKLLITLYIVVSCITLLWQISYVYCYVCV